MEEIDRKSRSNSLFGVSARLGLDLQSAREGECGGPRGPWRRRHMDVKGAQALADRIAEAAMQVVTDRAESSEEGNEHTRSGSSPGYGGKQHPLDPTAAVRS